jgi:PST family polysaccharide transporter
VSAATTNSKLSTESVARSSRTLKTDSFALSLILMLGLTVLQRGVGFFRGILFCRWLPPQELGHWDLCFSFLLLAAPFLVLGLPGSFGRYAEHFRHRGQLRPFLTWTTLAAAVLASGGILLGLCFASRISWLVFHSTEYAPLAVLILAVLVTVVAFNFLIELFTALRQMRVVSGMQLTNSLMFAMAGGALILLWQPSVAAVVAAYGLACATSVVIGGACAVRVWRHLPQETPLTQRDLWSRLAPFAAWIWLTNLAANLFSVADRYMIVHFSSYSAGDAAEMVGVYHSVALIPLLMVAVAGMFSGMLLPYLSRDWEADRRELVDRHLNLTLKLVGLVLTAGGIVIMAFAPWIFEQLFHGKFIGALDVLPLAIAFCVWLGLSVIAQNYLWCAERARLATLAYSLGLVVNVVLNLLLLPRLGLEGALLATAAANAVGLSAVLVFSRQLGMRVHHGVWLIVLLPATLTLGLTPVACVWMLAVVLCASSCLVLSRDERQWLTRITRKFLKLERT